MKKLFTIALLIAGTLKIATAQTPNWKWAESGNGGNYEYGMGISLDSSGDIFIGARCSGTMTIGGKNVTGGTDNPFVGRFDNSGNAKWLEEYSYSGNYDYPLGLCIDDSDNVYSTGSVSSGGDLFINKHNRSGVLKWTFTTPGEVYGVGLAADKSGNVYLTGNMPPGSFALGSKTITNGGSNTAIFIAKLDSNGNYIWAKSIYGTGSSEGANIITDNQGNIYFYGSYTGQPVFDTITVPTSSGVSNIFLAKYDTAGNAEWVTTASGAGDAGFAQLNGLAMDPCGNLFVTGFIQDTLTAHFGSLSVAGVGGKDIFLAKCSANGQWEWVKSAGGSGNDYGSGLAIDKNADIYIGGDFGGNADFGNGVSLSSGAAYVAKYANSTGDVQWAQSYGANGNFGGLAVDANKFVYVTGSFSGSAAFSSTSLSCSSAQNPYLAVLDTLPNRQIIVTPAAAYCPGSSAQLPFTTIGTFNGGNSFTAQLSDSTGSFLNPVSQNLGSTGNNNGNISIVIPPGTPNGSNYIIRVVSSNPAYSSFDYCFRVKIGGSFSISINPSDTSVCSGSQVQFNAGSASSYTWSSTGNLSCTSCSNPVVIAGNTADTLTLNATSLSGCSATVQAFLQISGSATRGKVTAARDTICLNTPGSLTLANNSGNGIQWQSSTDDANFTNDINDTLIKYKTTPLQQTTWYRAITGSGSCTAISDTLRLYVPPPLVASFYFTQTTPNQLTFNSDSSLGKIRSYHWDFGDNATSSDSNPSHTFAKDTTYYVCLTLYDGSNCSYTFCQYSSVTDAVPTVSAVGNWVVYPNPFSEQLIVSSKQNGSNLKSIEMYDVLGRLVINKNLDNSRNTSVQLDVSSLAKGMYYLMIKTAGADYVQKVVKQ